MKEFVDKLISRFEEKEVQAYAKMDGGVTYQAYRNAIEIVIELAEEYNNDFCEWKKGRSSVFPIKTNCGNSMDVNYGYEFCPYCGKKIKVV